MLDGDNYSNDKLSAAPLAHALKYSSRLTAALSNFLPQVVRASIGLVDVTNASPSHTLHKSTKISNFSSVQSKIGEDSSLGRGGKPASTFDLGLSEALQKESVIIIGENFHMSIVSALDNVMQISGICDPRPPCHGKCTFQSECNLLPAESFVKEEVFGQEPNSRKKVAK